MGVVGGVQLSSLDEGGAEVLIWSMSVQDSFNEMEVEVRGGNSRAEVLRGGRVRFRRKESLSVSRSVIFLDGVDSAGCVRGCGSVEVAEVGEEGEVGEVGEFGMEEELGELGEVGVGVLCEL